MGAWILGWQFARHGHFRGCGLGLRVFLHRYDPKLPDEDIQHFRGNGQLGGRRTLHRWEEPQFRAVFRAQKIKRMQEEGGLRTRPATDGKRQLPVQDRQSARKCREVENVA